MTRWTIVDALTVAGRDVRHWLRQPAVAIVGLLFPVLMVVMFGYLLGGGMSIPGGGDYREFLMPGMFAMTMLFGIEATYAAVATDANRGITDRFRSMPMAASAVVSGRALADMLNSMLGLGVMVLCGLVVGWRAHNGLGAALAAFGLLLLLRFAVLWMGIFFGLALRSPEALQAVQILVWPLVFLSNALAAPETMPGWLGVLVAWNPLSATVSATRELFGNPGFGAATWTAQHATAMAVVWPAALIAVFLPLSVRRYARLSK
jgi:ABC-2 type transport system permease protein